MNCEDNIYYTYIIRSEKDASFYIGYTSDLTRRLEFHNRGLSRYTSRKTPWILFYYEVFGSKSQAIKRENFLKKQRNTKFYHRLKNNS